MPIRLFLLGLFLFITSAEATTSVWQVSCGTSTFYLGGTCHLLRPQDFPLPMEFERAYEQAAVVAFETDLSAWQEPAAKMRLMSKMILKGKTLKDVLTPRVYQELSNFCTKRGIAVETVSMYKPAFAMILLAFFELQKVGVAEEGVDRYYHRKCLEDGKTVKALESLEQHIQYLSVLDLGQEDAIVEYSLHDMQRMGSMFLELVNIWKAGNEVLLQEKYVDALRQQFPALYRVLLVERNRQWMPQLEAYLQNEEKELVLVGAAHLVGPDGLLAMLEKRGYRVVQMVLR